MPRWIRRSHIIFISLVTLVLLVVAALFFSPAAELMGYRKSQPPRTDVEWGVTFSQKAAEGLGLDWRATYTSIIRDLHPSGLRLVAYWDLVEPQQGRYDFRDLDWQMAQARAAHIPVILCVGEKAPRWPEYHVPGWAGPSASELREQQLLAYVRTVVERYRGDTGVQYWQVENEPFVWFGEGGATEDPARLGREVALVRKLDGKHPVMLTDGGEWGQWQKPAAYADLMGVTLYRRVFDQKLGNIELPLTPEYYARKAERMRATLNRPKERVICAELSAEPWGAKDTSQLSLSEQRALFTPQMFSDTVTFARETRFDAFYFWGAEWWFYRKQHGDASYWDLARGVIRSGERAPDLASRAER